MSSLPIRCTTKTFPQRDGRVPALVCDDESLTDAQWAEIPAIAAWDQQTPLWLVPEVSVLPIEVEILLHRPASGSVVMWPANCPVEGSLWAAMIAFGSQLQRQGWTGTQWEQLAQPLPDLGPGQPAERFLVDAIGRLCGRSSRMTTLLRAGLLLRHDRLDESHTLSQTMEGDPDADLWHAIMHRREPDATNAKYWFRRVGSHPIFPALHRWAAPRLRSIGQPILDRWDPLRFVDLCERVRDQSSTENQLARQIQWMEIELHLKHCAAG